MRILIAEDEPLCRRLLVTSLGKWGYEIVVTCDGTEAWQALQREDAPQLAILDWMMPGMDGIEVCKKVRGLSTSDYMYIILLTAKGRKGDIVIGLEAGADDYITKPFNLAELRSRLQAGERIVTLEAALAHKVRALQAALAEVKQLQGLLPICMHCQKIRDGSDTWHKLETYIEEHSGVMFSHALCDECLATYYPEEEDDKEHRQ
jgi:DNA-binding response OmpR family regulator